MQSTRRYSIGAIIRWQKKVLLILLVLVSIPVLLYSFFGWEWLKLPWQPIGLIGIAVSFYLGFKNNSSYDRLWEGRKIWGGIVNASRSFTVMARDFVETPEAKGVLNTEERHNVQKSLVHRHVAWLYALSFQMRKPKKWEHFKEQDENFRVYADTNYEEEKFTRLKPYLSEEEYEYLMTKGNK
ncbi:MAG: bestrophin family ion channel, partial [Bacteroidota bacterium]